MLSFWVRRNGQEEWQPVPAEGAILEEDTYTVLAHCPQPYFTITVEVRHRPLAAEDEQAPAEAKASKGELLQTRSVRTNEEGIAIILPATRLAPGSWELHCRDADLIAELFGEKELKNCLRFQVVPAPAQSEPAAALVAQPTEPESAPQPKEPAPPPELFSLMHSELEGSPEEVLVLTGRIGCSGELQVRLWQEGSPDPLFQGRRQIQLPGQARTAVFSIPLTLPSQPWARPLQGEVCLAPSSWQHPELLRVPFSVRCRGQGEGPPSLPQEAEPPTPEASPASTTTLLSPERTLQKLLRIWQRSASGGKEAPDPLPPQELPASPTPPAEAAAKANAQPGVGTLPTEPPGKEAVLPAQTEIQPTSPSAVTDQNPETLPLPPGVCPAPQLLVPEHLRAGDNFDVVLRLPASLNSVSSSSEQPPLWIKFWVKHGRTRSLVDGPRWLLDFSRNEQGQWQALTRMTIPPGVPELIFEAWAVSPDRQQQSDRVTEHRSILP
jgi:hypothetical protein